MTAIFCAGMYDYDSNFVYAPLVDVQRMLNLGDKVSTIEVFLNEGTSVAEDAPRGHPGGRLAGLGVRLVPGQLSASSPPSRARPT